MKPFLAVTLVVLVAVGLWLSVDWALWQRWLNRPENVGEWPASFYQPTTAVGGSAAPFFPAAAPDELTLSAAALEDAAAYAEAHNSAALLVLHRGRLQLERYWQGIGPKITAVHLMIVMVQRMKDAPV